MRRFEKFALATVTLLGFMVPLLASAPAHAICDEPRTIYEFKNVKKTERLTNVRGDWMEAGFRASYADSVTAQVSASMTATVSAEAGIVFAKASASIGMTVGASWSKAKTWTYTGPEVPRGKEGRVVMYRESRKFVVTKKSLRSPCNYVTVYTATVDAPTSNGTNIWRMQYRNAGARMAPGRAVGIGRELADEVYEEVDLAVEEDEDFDDSQGEGQIDETDGTEGTEGTEGASLTSPAPMIAARGLLRELLDLAAAGLARTRRLVDELDASRAA